CLIGRAGQRLCRVHHVIMGGHQLIERAAGFLKECTAGLKSRLLPEQGGAGAGMQADVSIVGAVLPAQKSQQGSLAHTVRTDQADTVTPAKFETDIGKQRPFIKAAGQTGATQQQHRQTGSSTFACKNLSLKLGSATRAVARWNSNRASSLRLS